MLNWLARYAPIVPLLEPREDAPADSLLEVGSGAHGIACASPDIPFVGLDVSFEGVTAPSMLAIKAPPGPLPFVDGAFTTVLSLDTLEHVPGADRASFVQELARVSAERVIVACPSQEAAAADRMIRGVFESSGAMAPRWLDEHDEHGLPTAEQVFGYGEAIANFSARPLPTVNGLLSLLAVLADTAPELSLDAMAEVRDHGEQWQEVFRAGCFGASYRKGFILERAEAGPGLVEPERLSSTVVASLRCPTCRHAFEALSEYVWQCTGCHRLVAPDSSGVWDLGAGGTTAGPVPSRPKTAVPARRPELLLTAEWARAETWLPAVSAFLSARSPSRPADLLVDGGAGVPQKVAEALLDVVRARHPDGAAPGRLADARGEPELHEAVPAHDGGALLDALGAERPSPPADPNAIVARARDAKRLADEAQAVIDRHQLAASPPVAGETEPLVSVPIHTWRGGEVLVSRTIPSVLNGSYERVEVVVCSDGPDETARAAVERIGDPRVRFMALNQRPTYPDHPYSFWLTAGTPAANRARAACRGAFIAPLDHDDAFTPDHIAALLTEARLRSADFVYGTAMCEHPDGYWFPVGSAPLAMGQVTHGAVLHSRRLGHMRFDPHCWLLGEPGDWNLWRRMAAAGAEVHHHPGTVLMHFREKSSVSNDPRVERRHLIGTADVEVEALARDILETDARWLLSVVPASDRAWT